MKIAQESNKNISNVGNASRMGIAEGKEAVISQLLRDSVYSDKILAVVREWTSNALDEHEKYGIKSNVRMSIKDNVFSVRDYAKGLSDEGVRLIFGKYGASTKEKTNEIGGFGVGSKAGHAYQDSFTVISYHGGFKTTYLCVLESENGAKIGNILQMGQEPSNETGLEVSVGIKSGDEHNFHIRAWNLVKYCPKAVELHSNGGWNNIGPFYPQTPVHTISEPDFEIRLYKEDGVNSPIVQSGGIRYDAQLVEKSRNASHIHQMVVDFAVGTVQPALSREVLENTDTTQKTLKKFEDWQTNQIEAEIKALQKYDFLGFLKNRSALDLWAQVEATVFKFSWNTIYDTWVNLAKDLDTQGIAFDDLDKLKNKPVIVVYPDNRNTNLWKSRIKQALVDNGQKYWMISEIWKNHDLLNEHFTIINKSKVLPKSIPSDRKTFVVSNGFGQKLGKYNLLGAVNRLFGAGLGEEATEQDIKDYIQDYYKHKIALGKRVPIIETRYDTWYRCPYSEVFFTAKTFHKILIEAGVMDFDQFKAIKDDIKTNHLNIKNREDAVEQAKVYFGRMTWSRPQIHKALEHKDYKYLQNLLTKLKQIREKSPIRKKILDNAGYNHFNRAELREVLNLTK